MNVDAKTLLKAANGYAGVGHAGFAQKATTPPPGPGRWVWIDDQWILVASDADDDELLKPKPKSRVIQVG